MRAMKFGETILEATGEAVDIPDRLAADLAKLKRADTIPNDARAREACP